MARNKNNSNSTGNSDTCSVCSSPATTTYALL